MRYLIGVVGENGAGKDTFTTFLTSAAAPLMVSKHHFSDVLYETLNLWGIETSRSNLQNLAIIMDRQYGKGSLTKAIESELQKDEADIVVVEGVRWKTDVPMIKKFPKSLLVYVTAQAKLRYNRILKRQDKIGESKTNYEQFLREEKAGTELDIPEIGAGADFKIENNGTIDEFREHVERIAKSFLIK